VKDGLYGASFVELRLNDDVFPTSAVELLRRVDIGDGGGIPELGIVYRELEDVKGGCAARSCISDISKLRILVQTHVASFHYRTEPFKFVRNC